MSARTPRRLRELDRRGWIFATVLVLAVAAPFVVSLLRAEHQHWVPSGDEAIMTVRSRDVFSAHPPLLGQPSTSNLYSGSVQTSSPGPMVFGLYAVPVQLLGNDWGMLVAAGAINLGSALVALWVLYRRAGPGVAVWGGVVLAAVAWSAGLALLTDPLNSNIGMFPLLALTMLCWSLWCDDRRLLPLAVLLSSLGVQSDLGIFIPVAAVTVWAGIGFVVSALVRHRNSPADTEASWPWILGAALIAFVCWLPTAIDQATGHPGNVTAMIRYATQGTHVNLGIRRGVDGMLRVAGLPPWLARHNLTGSDVTARLSPAAAASGAVVLLVVLVLAVALWRPRRDLALLSVMTLVLAGTSAVATAEVPLSLQAERLTFYLWCFPLAFCIAVSLGAAVGAWLELRSARPVPEADAPASAEPESVAASGWSRLQSIFAALGVVAAMVISCTAIAGHGVDSVRRDSALFGIDRRIGAAAVASVRAGHNRQPVLILASGTMAGLSVAPALAARLSAAGIRFQVLAGEAGAYGKYRVFNPKTVGSVLVVASSFGGDTPPPGRLLLNADLNPSLAAAVASLVTATKSGGIVPSAEASGLLAKLPAELATGGRAAIADLPTNPVEALTSPFALKLLADGYLARPGLDQRALELLQANSTKTLQVWDDDRVALYSMTVAQLHRYQPSLFG